MFAKITTGSLAAGLINYMDNVKEKDARILIAKGLCAASHEAICASFEIQASRNHTVSEKMLHIALAFSEKDSHRTKSDEFMTAFAREAGCTLHLVELAGENSHHIIEGAFKALARALRAAVSMDPDFGDQIPSTKGVL